MTPSSDTGPTPLQASGVFYSRIQDPFEDIPSNSFIPFFFNKKNFKSTSSTTNILQFYHTERAKTTAFYKNASTAMSRKISSPCIRQQESLQTGTSQGINLQLQIKLKIALITQNIV